MKKERLFTIPRTSKDFRWDYYKGSGAGGQKRNKTENCCRCTHLPSGAVGKSEEGRSKEQNKKKAFRRMAESDKFMRWAQIEAARMSGELDRIHARVEMALRNATVEVQRDGKWVKVDPSELTHEPGTVRVSDV